MVASKDKSCGYSHEIKNFFNISALKPIVVVWNMDEIICLLPNPTQEIECECIDGKPFDIHIGDGGNLVCRHGSNVRTFDDATAFTCPLEIES
jgi:hypothetical protein